MILISTLISSEEKPSCRAALLRRERALASPGDLVEMLALPREGWAEPEILHFGPTPTGTEAPGSWTTL